LLAMLDIFVLPSHAEGMSNALLEAMALGRPAVATAVGGNPDVVRDGVTGRLVPPGQPPALAAALAELLAEPARAVTLGAAARCEGNAWTSSTPTCGRPASGAGWPVPSPESPWS